MSQPNSAHSDLESSPQSTPSKVTPSRCLFGSTLSGVMAIAMYRLTVAIVQNFAAHPMVSDSLYVMRISAAVRTLVMGGTALATGIFAVVTLGLLALAFQLMWQRFKQPQETAIEP